MKQNLITEETVFAELKKAIVETLRVEENAIKPESSLIKDLGAESLDFLDINYRLEQTFGIKMARHFILEHIEEMFGEGSAIDEKRILARFVLDGEVVAPGQPLLFHHVTHTTSLFSTIDIPRTAR